MRLAEGILVPSALALLALATGGCASGPRAAPKAEAPVEPDARPEAPVQPDTRPEVEPASAPAEAEASPEEPAGAYGPKTVVIGEPEPEADESPTLADAARKAKESRAGEGAPIAVITDETLPEYAIGELSIAAEKPVEEGAAAEEEPGAPEGDAAVEEAGGEAYWRDRVRGARFRWRDLLEEITRLEGQVAELRQRFYAEDDGFYRDSQIKPAWDRALDRLATTRDEVRRAQENLETILHEGRLAGALPGWLREGIEYQPAVVETDDQPGIHEPSEPQIVDESDGSE